MGRASDGIDRDVADLLDGIRRRGSPASRILARLKTLFAWAVREEIIENDPTARRQSSKGTGARIAFSATAN